MNSKLKWAYKALRVGDAVDAALDLAPKTIIWSGLAMITWMAVGLNPVPCMFIFLSMAIVLALLEFVELASYIIVRALGFSEEELERMAQ